MRLFPHSGMSALSKSAVKNTPTSSHANALVRYLLPISDSAFSLLRKLLATLISALFNFIIRSM